MPNYKNRFKSPEFIEETIVDESGAKVGTLRIKPSSVLWKPVNKQKFFSVSLNKFAAWITSDEATASQTSK